MKVTEEEEQHQTPKKCKSPMHVVKEWIPICDEQLKPREGLEFANLEECENFYKSVLILLVLVFVNHRQRRPMKEFTSISILFVLNKVLDRVQSM